MIFDNTILDAIARGGFLSVFALCWVILLVRIVGLRSFSKMTNFDFVMTVAMGSLLAGASQASEWTGLAQILAAMASLFAVQFVASILRQRSQMVANLLENTPVFLMRDGVILYDALRATRVSESDLIAKLRNANALDLSTVHAAILETTGDVSVLHGGKMDQIILKDVAAN
ncbi:Protein of unknown function [Sulfitobacter marinus]|uniref:YetF C-terminal domain-containing protein n=1 Tax=Sulfitobacter marinus TaxID=394264 RepID=A0A1I6VRX1_9RHOB|nr:YetF domain-containing protein [Sulfitobacter marinus]SFT16446.1 Protein of unknown function [Sulfitobacter marinus]